LTVALCQGLLATPVRLLVKNPSAGQFLEKIA
jgi:hypothetical protein